MAQYLGKVSLGALYMNGAIKDRPLKPWDRTTAPFSGCAIGDTSRFYTDATIKDTPSNEAQKLYWHKIQDGNKILWICDRVLAMNTTWTILKYCNLVFGKTITIDGKEYTIRLLTGGVYPINVSTTDEWNRFVVNTDNISGLPIPTATDLDRTLNSTDLASNHNQFWNWVGAESYCQESNIPTNVGTTTRGGTAANRGGGRDGSVEYSDVGWRPVLEILNASPTISGNGNEDLGDNNTPFNITYSVNDSDSANVLNIVEKLNGSQINSISNAPRNTNFTINITKEILDSLPLNQQNTILISVTDGSATTYKTITFTRTNSGPTIDNVNKDLGEVSNVEEIYTCHDVEGNTFYIVEKVDNVEIKTFSGVDGTEYTTDIPRNIWFKLTNGVHTYTVIATDSLGASTVRTFTFTKKETVIESTGLAKIFDTDAAATKILLTPSWSGIENATVKIEVCNNAHDIAPTWEDATSQVLINKAYMFTNNVKTADKWGIDVKFKITRKEGTTASIDFYGLGGAFE